LISTASPRLTIGSGIGLLVICAPAVLTIQMGGNEPHSLGSSPAGPPVLIEHLDSVVPAIGDEDMALRTANEDVVWLVEIAGGRSFMSPSLDESAILREFHDAGRVVLVGRMAIRHEDIAI
jgi:hypothetical protein